MSFPQPIPGPHAGKAPLKAPDDDQKNRTAKPGLRMIQSLTLGVSITTISFMAATVHECHGGVVLTGLEPSLHRAVDSRDVIAVPHPTHLPHGLHLQWGFLMPPFEGFPWRP